MAMNFHDYPYTDLHEMNLDWCIAKVKELTAAWAVTRQDWTDTQQAWEEMKTYINNYFDNLNVQTEINNKLDALVADGTLSDLISPFVASGLPSVVADQLGDVVAAQIGGAVAAQISAVVADQLPAVVATETAGQAAAWLAEHVDPETGYVIDDSLTIAGAAADAKAAGDAIGELKSALTKEINLTRDELNVSQYLYTEGGADFPFTWLNYAMGNDGKPSSANNTRLISEPILLPKNCAILAKRLVSGISLTYGLFDETDTRIGTQHDVVSSVGQAVEIEVGNAKYIRVYTYFTNDTPISPTDAEGMTAWIFAYSKNGADTKYAEVVSENLVDTSKSTIGKYIASNIGTLDSSSSYDTTDFIPTKGNNVVFNKKIRKLLCYDKYKMPISASYVSNEQTAGYVLEPSASETYVRVSYYHADRSEFKAEYGDTATSYVAYKEQIEEGVHASQTILDDVMGQGIGNVLYGKKWVSCGDSFTQGDFSNAPVDNYHITDGKYAGQLAVYPYLIGNRNNMTIVNEAISGSTMTHIDGRDTAFSDTRYQDIPADADYITLKFGINDDSRHQDVPIGTIDDATNETFYGAWNVVMNYLITHHLDAKIGIIITNGATVEIANATIAIAEKWGVPYLNEATGEQCSYVFRSNRTTIPQAIRNAKNENWYVHATEPINAHPNAAAHRFESTVVEEWLRSL